MLGSPGYPMPQCPHAGADTTFLQFVLSFLLFWRQSCYAALAGLEYIKICPPASHVLRLKCMSLCPMVLSFKHKVSCSPGYLWFVVAVFTSFLVHRLVAGTATHLFFFFLNVYVFFVFASLFGQGFTMYSYRTSNLWQSSCLYLSSAGIIGVRHHTWLLI